MAALQATWSRLLGFSGHIIIRALYKHDHGGPLYLLQAVRILQETVLSWTDVGIDVHLGKT